MAGMVTAPPVELGAHRPLIAATMFGVTAPSVTAAREELERRGYEVLTFHATGTGGRAMEALVESGFVTGGLDNTTTGLAHELVGGGPPAGTPPPPGGGEGGGGARGVGGGGGGGNNRG